MQAQGNIIERIVQAYIASRGVRVFCVLAELVSVPLLFVLAGGFPPYAWRLLAQALPQFPALLALRGPVALLALLGLLLLSVTILIAWSFLLWLGWRMVAYWRYERQELRHFAVDAKKAQYQAEESRGQHEKADSEDQPVYWQTGRVTLPATRRRVIYPPAPLSAPVRNEEYNPERRENDPVDEEESFFLEDEEEADEMAIYRDEDDEDEAGNLNWSRQPVTHTAGPAAPARPFSPTGQVGTTFYDQRPVERSSPAPDAAVAHGENAGQGHHTSYGRILPFSAAPSAGALPHLTSTPYNRVSLPHPASAPSPAKRPATPQRIEPTQPASVSVQSARPPLAAPQSIAPTQPASASVQSAIVPPSAASLSQSAKLEAVVPQRQEPAQSAAEAEPDARRVPILPAVRMAQAPSPVPEQSAQQVVESSQPSAPLTHLAKLAAIVPQHQVSAQPIMPVQPPASQPLAPRPTVQLTAPVPQTIPAQPTNPPGVPAQPGGPGAGSAWSGKLPAAPAQPPAQPGAVQSLMELISTVPMEPQPARIELASTIPMVPPTREPIPLAPPLVRAEAAARQATTQLIVSTGLDVGLKRRGKPNEDSLLALQNTRILRGGSCPVGLFVVADGMGGHENGQEASNLVIQSLSKTVMPAIIYGPTDDNYSELLAEGVHHANLEIYQRNRQAKVDMGTTIVAALVIDTTAYIVSAGDSRVYLYRTSRGLSQVTRDHSTVARLVESGLIKPDEVYTHPRRNEIYRSLGHHPSEDLDKFILALQPDDVLLLCSDGLWEMVRDHHIREIIANTAGQPAQTSAALVQAALDGGGKDNISVIVVYVKAALGAQAAWAG